MIASTPVEKVAEILEEAAYRRLPVPLNIGDLQFDFPAAFVGSDRSPDLVIITDTASESDQKILRKLEGVGRALDIMRSKRPLTVIVAGPRPSPEAAEAMARIGRLLFVGQPLDDNPAVAMRNSLAVLLPLKLPETQGNTGDPIEAVRGKLTGLAQPVANLVEHAKSGTDAVQSSLYSVLRSALEDEEIDHA